MWREQSDMFKCSMLASICMWRKKEETNKNNMTMYQMYHTWCTYIHTCIAPAKYRNDNIICEYFEDYRVSLVPHSRTISKCLMFKTKVAKFLHSTFFYSLQNSCVQLLLLKYILKHTQMLWISKDTLKQSLLHLHRWIFLSTKLWYIKWKILDDVCLLNPALFVPFEPNFLYESAWHFLCIVT